MIKFVFNEDELDWIDYGQLFCSRDDEPIGGGDIIADRIISELKNAWSNEKFKNIDQYEVEFSDEEVEYIYEIMIDMFLDAFSYEFGDNQELIGREDNEDWMSLKERLDLTNKVFKKFNKSILPIESLKKSLED